MVIDRFAAVAPSDTARRRLERIAQHLDLLAEGHDPCGRLLAIERLARATRSEWNAVVQARPVPKS